MNDQIKLKPMDPVPRVELVEELHPGDINDLCDATDEAIKAGGGFGWVELPPRDKMERYWHGVIAMPSRALFVARLDNVICGTCQIIMPPSNNEAQSFATELTTNFVAPWARGHGLAKMLLENVEKEAIKQGFSVLNLSVRETMERAISLYEAMGYIRCGTHPYYAHVNDEVIQGYYYYKVINPKAFD